MRFWTIVQKPLDYQDFFSYNITAYKKMLTKTVSYVRKAQRAGKGGSPVQVKHSRRSLSSCGLRKPALHAGKVVADGIPPLSGKHMMVCLGGVNAGKASVLYRDRAFLSYRKLRSAYDKTLREDRRGADKVDIASQSRLAGEFASELFIIGTEENWIYPVPC